MDYALITKGIAGLAACASAVAVFYLNSSKLLDSRSRLIKHFEEALAAQHKYSVVEIFRMLHGLDMRYSDIVKLVDEDDSIQVIYLLKKLKGFVRYRNGYLQYQTEKDSFLLRLLMSMNWVLSIGALILLIGSLGLLPLVSTLSLQMILFLSIGVFSIFLVIQVKEISTARRAKARVERDLGYE